MNYKAKFLEVSSLISVLLAPVPFQKLDKIWSAFWLDSVTTYLYLICNTLQETK